MSLIHYHRKRNFKKSNEPIGKIHYKTTHLYIIQKHAASHLHYDFRIELNGVLKSWAIPKGPCLDPTVKRLAIHVEDHPIEYGAFEGTIPKGQYGGGAVLLWDKGEWHSKDENPQIAYHKGHLHFELKAKKLKGLWDLVRIHSEEKNDTWLLIKNKDRYARALETYDILEAKPKSVISGKLIHEII
ncbi:MAG TPA: DNA polymerase ligase N-terminal domain-containing protein [Legionellaceae bacterium]|nr:DNA polymerase ligase N-terminal domain-containing protein [Legionellaceae bacterium]